MPLKILQTPIAKLRPHPANPRTITPERMERLKRDLEHDREMLEVRPLIALPDGTVIAGNQRLQAAQALGWEKIPCATVDLDDDRAREWAVRDNRPYGEDDLEMLAAWVQPMESLEFTGLTSEELTALVEAGLRHVDVPAPPEEDPGRDTDPIEPPAEPVTQPGDLIVLGEHRLLCGDATDPVAVEMLGVEQPSVVMTDPPYGVDYGKLVASRENQKAGGWRDMAGDELDDDELEQLVHNALVAAPAPVLFVWHASSRAEVVLRAIRAAGWEPAQQIVWIKNALVFGRADYQWRHEPCIYARRDGGGGVDDRTQTTVWEFDKPTGTQHPATKPVGLFETAYRNHSHPGDLVYDPFAGSGTAMLAAENLGRRARLMEIDPGYCDVIVDRYERHTGLIAERPQR